MHLYSSYTDRITGIYLNTLLHMMSRRAGHGLAALPATKLAPDGALAHGGDDIVGQARVQTWRAGHSLRSGGKKAYASRTSGVFQPLPERSEVTPAGRGERTAFVLDRLGRAQVGEAH